MRLFISTNPVAVRIRMGVQESLRGDIPGPGTVYFDLVQGLGPNVPGVRTIDDFESYTNTAALEAAWVDNTGNPVQTLETVIVNQGGKAMRLDYDTSGGRNQGVELALAQQSTPTPTPTVALTPTATSTPTATPTPTPAPPPPDTIPTLDWRGFASLIGLLALVGVGALRRLKI